MATRPLVVAPTLLTLALVGCSTGQSRPIQQSNHSEARLSQFADCDDLRSYLIDAWTEEMLESAYGWGRNGGGDVALAEDSSAESGGDGGGGPTDWSETNTQEADVDEPDLVKTNGEYLFVVQDDELHVVDSWPPEDASLVATLPLSGWGASMFLHEDRLLLLGSDYVEGQVDGEYRYQDLTTLTLVDVSDPTAPAIERVITVDGYLNDARMIDGHVYAVTNQWSWLPWPIWEAFYDIADDLPEPVLGGELSSLDPARVIARPQVEAIVTDYVNSLSDDDLVPLVRDGLEGEDPAAQPLLTCGEIYRPETLADPSTSAITHLDLGEAEPALSATGLMAVGWDLYASVNHLTIAQTSASWWGAWGQADVSTHLHRFALDEFGAIYEGSGAVDGWLLNQFSMSDHDGYLRVATTDVTWWGGAGDDSEDAPANNVFVLEPTGTSLEVVGHVGGIAPGETIQSARFLGNKGFLVTYEQVDPLFTLDLSDPTNPQVIGELKIPGFSTYLHPYDNDTLVAVGFAGTWEGEITGMAITMFDVSDFANPVVADEVLLESDDWSWSEALYDHHAFTLHNGILSLPIYTWTWDGSDEEGFSGMLVLDVDAEAGFTELGRVDHTDMVAASACPWYENSDRPCEDEYYWYASMRRSVVIEDSLYSISNYGVKVTGHEDPSDQQATVLFHPVD